MSGVLGPLVTYNWNPSTQLKNLLTAESEVENGSGNGATIVFLGDSTTDGFGTASSNYIATTSLPAQVVADLDADGVTANQADFMGQGNELAIDTDSRVSLFGGATWSFPMGAGGEIVGMSQVGAGVTFTPGSAAATRSLTLDYYDMGSATLVVSVNGQSVGTVTVGNTGLLSATTLTLPTAEIVTSVTVTDTNGASAYLEGVTLASAAASIQVIDAGVGGAESSIVGAGMPETNSLNANPINAEAQEKPTVAFVDFGINDVLQGNLTAAETTANLKLMVQELQSVGTEAVIVIPNPIAVLGWAAEIPTLRADVYALADQLNVGVIDLSATSDDDAAILFSKGLLTGDGVHPTAAYDTQVATQLAALLTPQLTPALAQLTPAVAQLNPAATCFCPGSLIRTDRGEMPVEALEIGNCIITTTGAANPIRWIGRRTYDGRFVAGNHLMLPICIKAGALASNTPARDLYVSPGHAMFVDGQLVPAWRLVNGVSIIQAEAVDTVTYYHIELDAHAIIFTEGALAESFLDDGCRGQFHNAHEFERLYPNAAAMAPLQARLEDGFALQAIQERLASRAGVMTIVEPMGALRGFVDIATPERVTGWAQDVDNPEEPVVMEISAGGTPVQCVLANGYRADLRQAGMGSGCHAFDTALPEEVSGRIEVRRVTDGSKLARTVDTNVPDALQAA
jgi:lysophospholipase L1-like esterase